MRLQKLAIKNFRGIESFELVPDGKSLLIFGANYTGKTTLADAGTYIITGKDIQDRMPDSFGIKTREVLTDGSLGDEIHGLEHVVEATYLMDNGSELTLKKVYTEDWSTKKGSSKEYLKRHTTQYHWDGEPNVPAGEFTKRLEEYCTIEEYKMLSLPDYFAEQMHWTKRREVLSSLAGEITDRQVIQAAPYLDGYIKLLDGKTRQAVEKTLTEKKKNLNKELGTRRNPGRISARIDENQRKIVPIEGVEDARKTVKDLEAKKQKIEAKRSEVEAGRRVAELNVEKRQLEAEKQDLKNKHQQQVSDSLSKARKKVSELQDRVDEIESEFRGAQREYESKKHATSSAEGKVDKTLAQISEAEERTPQPESDFEPDKCPVCERPYEDAEHDYDVYLEEFNAQKAKDIKELNEILGIFRKEANECAKEFAHAGQKAANIKGKLNQRQKALETAQGTLQEQKMHQEGFDSSDIDARIAEIDQKIANHQAVTRDQIEYLDAEISKLDQQIEAARNTIHQAKKNREYRERISELKALQKTYGKELEEVEDGLRLIEDFGREKARLIESRVNDKFEHVSWQMFEYHISGGTNQVCNAVYKSRPFQILSNSEKIFAGVDIINTLSEYFGKSVPVWIDNRESCTYLPETDLQVISLIVSPEHKQLTVRPEGWTPEDEAEREFEQKIDQAIAN